MYPAKVSRIFVFAQQKMIDRRGARSDNDISDRLTSRLAIYGYGGKRVRRITSWGIILVLMVALVAIAGCGKGGENTTTTKATPVKVMKAGTGEIASASSLSGKIAAAVDVSVVPKTAGKVAEVPVKVGDGVKKGQVVVKLEGAELGAQVRQAQAALNMARANADVAQRNLQRMEELFPRMVLFRKANWKQPGEVLT